MTPTKETALEKFSMLVEFEKQADDGEKWNALERGILAWFFQNQEIIRAALQTPAEGIQEYRDAILQSIACFDAAIIEGLYDRLAEAENDNHGEPGTWKLCKHLATRDTCGCSCGYRGGVWSGDGEACLFEMGSSPEHDGTRMVPEQSREMQLNDAHFISASRTFVPEAIRVMEQMAEALRSCKYGDMPESDTFDNGAVESALAAFDALGEPK